MNPSTLPINSVSLPRILIFLRERFPLWPAALGLFFQSLLSLLALSNLSVLDGVLNSISIPSVIVQSFSVPLLFLLIRIADEFKDFEVDQRLFPERPLARGAVFLSDIRALAFSVLAFVLVIQYLVAAPSQVWLWLGVCLVFIFLMWRWFFFERQIRNSLTLALVTHNPSAFLLAIFLVSILPLRAPLIIFALGSWAGAAAWEIGRKIRAPQFETEYTTYSKIWGARKSMLLTLFLLTLSVVLQLWPFRTAALWVFAPALLGVMISLMQGLRFVIHPRRPAPTDVTGAGALGLMLSLASWLGWTFLL